MFLDSIKTAINNKKNERLYKKSGVKNRFSFDDFLYYRMQEMTEEEREEIMTPDELWETEKKCNADAYRDIFNDKRLFYKHFSQYMRREIVFLEELTFEQFVLFLEKHRKIFLKPPCQYAGHGTEVLCLDTEQENLPERFLAWQKKGYLAEEYIAQHKAYAEVYGGSVNTVRLCTLVQRDGTPIIFAATNQFGSAGSIVDNDEKTGIWGVIDLENGILKIPDMNPYNGLIAERHPDTGSPLVGFQNPAFSKMKELVLETAGIIPECRLIGWDVCLTREGTVELIEGNVTPEMDLFQYITRKGFRSFFVKNV